MGASFQAAMPERPLHLMHTLCETEWDLYCVDWPPQLVICVHCHIPLKLIAYDRETRRTTYRQIDIT